MKKKKHIYNIYVKVNDTNFCEDSTRLYLPYFLIEWCRASDVDNDDTCVE